MADAFTFEQVAAAATFVVSLCAVALILATLAVARRDILGSRLGWLLVATAMGMLAARVLGHFDAAGDTQAFRHVLGILAAPLLAAGFGLIFRSRQEARRDGAP